MKTLFPKSRLPYYIVAPSYTHISSGVRTLHLLCHALNEVGEKAQLVFGENPYYVNPNLNTPVGDPCAQFRDFIAVYPDITKGNPLSAKRVVRYLLAPAGAYGGDKEFPASDMVWGALPSLAENVLRLPVSDPAIFYPPRNLVTIPNPIPQLTAPKIVWETDTNAVRQGSCFYSHKYDRIHGNQLLPITENSVRLEGSLENIADILRKSTVCYLYEMSSIVTEAALCGCRVVLVRTPYFNAMDKDFMGGNVAWSDGEIVKECDDFKAEYDTIVADFWRQLDIFIEKTRAMA